MFLSLVFHNHQPVGQLPWSFEDAWRDAYSHFLEVLQKHPKVQVALHFTGPLLDWLCEHKPETIEQIRVLVARNQIEILSGGYYEPILAIWPRDDQLAQMRKLNARVSELFGQTPRGMWLAERVWEPQLASAIRQSQLEFTFVDSSVFASAGVGANASFDLFHVEAANETADIEYSKVEKETKKKETEKLAIFPINGTLRDLIPWRAPQETIDFLRAIHEKNHDAIVVFADDGEKFGGWPGTFHFVYKNANGENSGDDAEKARGWLDAFFTTLEANNLWLHTALPSQILAARAPLNDESSTRTVDLPAGSYAEMQSWSGGNWRHFLQKYHESRDLFDEVSRVRELVALSQNDAALDLILQAQSNDALWHGAFGGLYLRHLRQSIYAKTIEAQILIDQKTPFVRVQQETNGDWSLENEKIRIAVREVGGHIFNWTSKAARHNILSTLRRYHEPYHAPDNSEDWHARGALLDHFFGGATTPELFAQTRFPEQGDFVSEAWQIETSSSNEMASITLKRNGGVWFGDVHQALSMCKTISLQTNSDTLNIEYSIRNDSRLELDLWWANEWNVALSGTDAPTRHFHGDDHRTQNRLDEISQFNNVKNPIAADGWLQLQVEWEFEKSVDLWHVPIWSLSQKEGGETERSHQSSAFVFGRRLHLKPQIEYSISFSASLQCDREL